MPNYSYRSNNYQGGARYEKDNFGLEFHFNSKDIIAGTVGQGIYPTQGFPTLAIKSVTLESAEVPFTWYIFNSTNNKIIFNEGGSDLVATITPGNYTEAQLLVQIKTQMQAVGANTYTITYNANTYKLTIAGSAPFDLKWANTGTAYKLLGYAYSNLTGSSSYTAPNVINISGPNYVLLQVRNFVERSITSDLKSVSFKIPVDVEGGNVIFYTQNSGIDQPIFSQNTCFSEQQMQITLLDPDMNILDLNGANYSGTLRITFYMPP